MIGALSTSALVALLAVTALRPPMPRRSTPWNLRFAAGFLINEQPFLALWWLLSATTALWLQPDPNSVAWWLALGIFCAAMAALAILALRTRSVKPVLSDAFDRAFGAGAAPRYTRPPWPRILFLPFLAWRPDVRLIRNLPYGPARRGHRLDVYVSRRHRRTDAPILVFVHGGGFRSGSKRLGARSLLYRLASQGWMCQC